MSGRGRIFPARPESNAFPRGETMIDTKTAPYAALLLRLTLGVLFLAHASLKIFVFTPAGTAGFFQSIGLPAALAYVTMAWEVLGGFALILGVWPRLVAVAMIPVLLGALVTVHLANGFFFSNPNGGWEYLAFWIAAQLALALTGDGAFALKPGLPFGITPKAATQSL
jgi:putative oxidoreductase